MSGDKPTSPLRRFLKHIGVLSGIALASESAYGYEDACTRADEQPGTEKSVDDLFAEMTL